MRTIADRRKRWGVVLAGGDGLRLKPLTRLICGDDRPKQFCPLYGGATLLAQARQRAEQSILSDQILFSLTREHEEFYLPELKDRPSQRIVQPRNRGTAPAILSSLLRIAHQDPDATVAVFPSDHHYSDEKVITAAVEDAFELSRREPDSVVLLGARPHGPEPEYGWIEMGSFAHGRHDAFRVRGFYEKPSLPVVRLLFEQGALWNTFVMVGKTLAFLEMICSALPGVLSAFQQSPAIRLPSGEVRIPYPLYDRIPSIDFSRQVLAMECQRLIVQRLGRVAWSDLGDCERAVAALASAGVEPEWANHWRAAKPPESVTRQESLAALA